MDESSPEAAARERAAGGAELGTSCVASVAGTSGIAGRRRVAGKGVKGRTRATVGETDGWGRKPLEAANSK